MAKSDDPDDPRGLVTEAFRIEAISAEECRSIFFDWALGNDAPDDLESATRRLYERHSAIDSDHPMTAVLREGMESRPQVSRGRRRRGGVSSA